MTYLAEKASNRQLKCGIFTCNPMERLFSVVPPSKCKVILSKARIEGRFLSKLFYILSKYRIVSNKRPGGGAIFQKGDVYKRQVFNAKMQCLSLFTMTRRREI